MNITCLQPNTKKINDKKINDIKKVLHLISERSYYKYDFEKYYINKLAMTLKPSQWIAFNKFEYDNNYNNHYTSAYNKPAGFYCSKGEWFFYEKDFENETIPYRNLYANSDKGLLSQKLMNPRDSLAFGETRMQYLHDSYINFIDIDYTNIAVITNNHQAKKFIKKYSYKPNNWRVDWDSVKKDYYGLVLIPNFFYNPYIKNVECNLGSIKDGIGILLYGYDVSTLVFWDNRCVKNYRTLFNVSKYINEKNYTTYENKKKSTKLLINNIIKEIIKD